MVRAAAGLMTAPLEAYEGIAVPLPTLPPAATGICDSSCWYSHCVGASAVLIIAGIVATPTILLLGAVGVVASSFPKLPSVLIPSDAVAPWIFW